ncbi:MAG: FKBP-type peptidyl-prolyl cis-trans isomerase [Lachnospiraceae bacterium]|jgi:trigger factor
MSKENINLKNESEIVAENADETVETVIGTDEEDAADEEVKAVEKAAKASKKQPPVIKKKSGISPTTLITVIVCAVIVLACVGFVGYKLGWFHVPSVAQMTMDDYSTLEINREDVQVTEEELELHLGEMQTHFATTEVETEGVVAEGDSIHIVYEGTKDGVAFEGGSTGEEGTDITVGSSGYIEGFDDGLVGCNIGDTVALNLVFPKDYHNTDLAGCDVVFTVNIKGRNKTIAPELNDAFIKEHSAEYVAEKYGEEVLLNTVEEMKEFLRDYYYELKLRAMIEKALLSKQVVTSYDETHYNSMMENQLNMLAYYASYYGIDADTLATYYGFKNADEYAKNETESQLKLAMMYAHVAKDLGITHTAEEIDASLTEYMKANEYDDLDKFKEDYGETWLYLYENHHMNFEQVIDAVKDNVVIVEAVEEETEAEAETEVETETEAETETETDSETK